MKKPVQDKKENMAMSQKDFHFKGGLNKSQKNRSQRRHPSSFKESLYPGHGKCSCKYLHKEPTITKTFMIPYRCRG